MKVGRLALYSTFILLPIVTMGDSGHRPIKPVANAVPAQTPAQVAEQISKPEDAQLDQIVLTNFSQIVQNFFNIVKEPNNPANVGNNVAQMLVGIVDSAVQIFKNMPIEVSEEERVKYYKEVEHTLRKGIREMQLAKKNYDEK